MTYKCGRCKRSFSSRSGAEECCRSYLTASPASVYTPIECFSSFSSDSSSCSSDYSSSSSSSDSYSGGGSFDGGGCSSDY